MSRARTSRTSTNSDPVRVAASPHRRPNPVLLAGIASLTLTLLAGWWFVLRAPERSEVALCSSLTRLDGLDERLAAEPSALEDDVAVLSRAVRVAPSGIADDVEAVATAVATVHDEATRTGEDGGSSSATASLRAGMARIEPSADALSGSSDRVVAWAGEHCGLDLGGSTAAGSTTDEGLAEGVA